MARGGRNARVDIRLLNSTALAAAIEVAGFWLRHAGENRLLKLRLKRNSHFVY
jgi:primosomal replication protein N